MLGRFRLGSLSGFLHLSKEVTFQHRSGLEKQMKPTKLSQTCSSLRFPVCSFPSRGQKQCSKPGRRQTEVVLLMSKGCDVDFWPKERGPKRKRKAKAFLKNRQPANSLNSQTSALDEALPRPPGIEIPIAVTKNRGSIRPKFVAHMLGEHRPC